MPETPDTRPERAPDLPPALLSDLRRLHHPGAGVPRSVDEAVLVAARVHLARRRRRRPWLVALPLAAAALFAVLLLVRQRETPRARPAFARDDLDHSGAVDILDAFQLARWIEAGSPALDLDGDGAVDQRDVDWLAAQAVRL